MSRKPFTFALLSFITVALATPVIAQSTSESRLTLSGGAGYTITTGDFGNRLTNGWNVTVGAGYKVNDTFSVVGEYSYFNLGVSEPVLLTLRVPDGKANVVSITGQSVVSFGTNSTVGGYVIGGGGAYRRYVEFSQPTTAVININDPWWGYDGPIVVSANTVLGSISTWAGGFNVGGGITFRLNSDSDVRIFAEFRYHRAYTRNLDTQLMPITFGVRW